MIIIWLLKTFLFKYGKRWAIKDKFRNCLIGGMMKRLPSCCTTSSLPGWPGPMTAFNQWDMVKVTGCHSHNYYATLRKTPSWSSHCGAVEMNLTRIPEARVWSLALLSGSGSGILRGCGIGQQLYLPIDPCGPKKKEKKKKKRTSSC